LACLSSGSALAAQTPPVTWNVRVGFDGYIRPGTWAPVRVDVSNNGPDLKAQIAIVEPSILPGNSTQFVRPIELPRQSHKQVVLYWMPETVSTPSVRLVAGNTVLAEQVIRPARLDQRDQLYGLLSHSPSAFTWLTAIRPTGQTARVAQLTIEDIPSQADALEALSALIVHDADTGMLTQSQRDALRHWVERGGLLIVTGGSYWQRTTAGLTDLLPIAVSKAQSIGRLDALAHMSAAPITGPVLVASGTVREGVVRAAQDGVPLIVERSIGLGRVNFIAWDPAAEPLASWSGNAAIWSPIIQADSAGTWIGGVKYEGSAIQALGTLPGAALPPLWQICGFLLLYILAIGPLNYYALRRLNRRELAWLTVPLISLLFTGCAYLVGFQARGPIVTLHRLLVVQGQADQPQGQADALIGIFSPRRGTYDVQISPDALLKNEQVLARPLRSSNGGTSGNIVVEEGEPLTLRQVRVDVGAMQTFAASLAAPLPRIWADLTIYNVDSNGAQLSGQVRNDSDLDLSDVVILVGNGGQWVNELKAGQTLAVNLTLNRDTWQYSGINQPTSGGGNNLTYLILGTTRVYSDRTLRCRASMLNAVGSGMQDPRAIGGVYLAGWAARAPLKTLVNGAPARQEDQVLYLIELPVRVNLTSSTTLPPGLITRQATGGTFYNPQYPHQFSPYHLSLSAGQSVIMRFRPWRQAVLSRITAGIIRIDSSPATAVTLEVYNMRTNQWDLVAKQLSPYTEHMSDLADYVSSDGALQVRLTPSPSSGSAYVTITRIEITLEGEK